MMKPIKRLFLGRKTKTLLFFTKGGKSQTFHEFPDSTIHKEGLDWKNTGCQIRAKLSETLSLTYHCKNRWRATMNE